MRALGALGFGVYVSTHAARTYPPSGLANPKVRAQDW